MYLLKPPSAFSTIGPAATEKHDALDGQAFLHHCMSQRFDSFVELIQTDGGSQFKKEFEADVSQYCNQHRVAWPYKKPALSAAEGSAAEGNEQGFIRASTVVYARSVWVGIHIRPPKSPSLPCGSRNGGGIITMSDRISLLAGDRCSKPECDILDYTLRGLLAIRTHARRPYQGARGARNSLAKARFRSRKSAEAAVSATWGAG